MQTLIAGTRAAGGALYKDAADIERGDILVRTGQRVERKIAFNTRAGYVEIHLYTSISGHKLRHPVKTFAGELFPVREAA